MKKLTKDMFHRTAEELRELTKENDIKLLKLLEYLKSSKKFFKGGKNMKFKLGQKVKYKRISKKTDVSEQYLNPRDFEEDEEKILERRESIELNNERTGYIAGRRRFTFKTHFQVETDSGDDWEPESEYIVITRQEYGFVYLVAYDMGKTNYVLEEDLKEVINAKGD